MSDADARFTADGFATDPRFFSRDETAALRADLDRLLAEGRLRNVATDGDGATRSASEANLQVCPVGPFSPLIRALHRLPRLRARVDALIGAPTVCVLDQIFLKPARAGRGTSWHQDLAYWPDVEARRGLGVWIALHDAHRANGTMHVVAGSHRDGLRRHERDPGSDHHLHTPDVDEAAATAIELPAGGALFFGFGVLHRTGGNGTDAPRGALALHFYERAHAPERWRALVDERDAVRDEADWRAQVAASLAASTRGDQRGAAGFAGPVLSGGSIGSRQ